MLTTPTTTPHPDHLTRARASLFDAQLAVLHTIRPDDPAHLTGSRASRAVELVELITAAIAHCERLRVVVEGDARAEQAAN